MAEGGLPAPAHRREEQQPPPIPEQPQLGQQVQRHMNWSHLNPEFSSKGELDVKAHLLRTNNWMTTHDFPDRVKVQIFYLTLTGGARN